MLSTEPCFPGQIGPGSERGVGGFGTAWASSGTEPSGRRAQGDQVARGGAGSGAESDVRLTGEVGAADPG